MWTRSELKSKAKTVLKANYWKVVLVSIIFTFVSATGQTAAQGGNASAQSGTDASSIVSSLSIGDMIAILAVIGGILAIGGLISLALRMFVYNPLMVGCRRFMIETGRKPTGLGEMLYVFTSGSYMNVVKVMFLRDLYTALWSLLLCIPGIVKSYEYSMIPFLLAEDASMSSKEAFATTKSMMTGNKWNAFVLDLSFIGWHILGALTLGILHVFYINPYVNLTEVQLYEALKPTVEQV